MIKRRVFRIGGVILFLLVVLVSGLSVKLTHWRAMDLVHPHRAALWTTPTAYGITDWVDVSFTTTDGLRLDGWFIPPAPEKNGATIIFVHGIGNNRCSLLSIATPLIAEGYGALLFDQRNNGTSEGHVTTLGYLEALDVQAALDFVRQQPGVASDRIGLLAHSMGTAGTLLAAARDGRVAATVTVSAYSSLEDNIAEGVRNLTGLPAFPFAPLLIFFGEREAGVRLSDVRPIDEVANIAPGAVFFIHGVHDSLINSQNSARLYAAAQEPKELYIAPDGTHNNLIYPPPADIVARISVFFGRYLNEW